MYVCVCVCVLIITIPTTSMYKDKFQIYNHFGVCMYVCICAYMLIRYFISKQKQKKLKSIIIVSSFKLIILCVYK